MQTLNAEKACNKGQKALGGRAGLNALLAAALLGTLPAMADDLSIPTLKDNSAYTLTKVDAAGENTITKFEYNIETGNLTPVYYRVDLKETTYGDGDASKYYTWTQDSEGHNQFTETTDIDALIQAKYDTSNPQNRFENKEDLSSVNGNFINQNNTAATGTSAYGGAIRNSSGTIGEINGDFVGNYVTSNMSSFGGAISGGTYGDITGDFIGNYALTTEYNPSTQIRGAHGGAINQANTGNIVGNFIGNHASSESYATGGAIYNATGYTIGDITGDFIGNYAEGKVEGVSGGAIHNYGSTIGDITGNFIGNYATNVEGGAGGGAINNYWRSEIGDITGDFIGNYAKSVNGSANGGAIAMMHDGNKLNNITGDFIGNYAESETNLAQGGAIYNWSFLQRENEGAKSINSIKGDFISNYAKGNEVEGGAFYNKSITGDITGNFINNAAISTTTEDNELLSSSFAQGGAIYNESSEGELGHITGDFVANYAIGKYAYGGAINNCGDMDGVTGNFVGNHIESEYINFGNGGAIYNYGNLKNIDGDFYKNYINIKGTAQGGAIYNFGSGLIDSITGNFIDNYIQSKELAYGGGIYNTGDINNITGNFSGNSAAVVESLESTAENSGSSTLGIAGGSTFSGVEGGAIYNTGVIIDINGDFTKNSAYTTAQGLLVRGGAISNNGRINKITGNFIENSVYLNTSQTNEEISTYILSENPAYSILAAEGGAIANDNEIELINSDFVKNSATSEDENVIAQGGAISNSTFGTIHDLQSNFLENKATGNLVTGGAIYNEGIIENITGTFQNNSVNGDTMAFGGAISNRGTIGTYGDNTISLAVLKGTIINEATESSMKQPAKV